MNRRNGTHPRHSHTKLASWRPLLLWDEVADINLCPKLVEASVGVETTCFSGLSAFE